MLHEMVSHWVVHLVMLHHQLQDMHQLGPCVSILDNDLLGPVGQHGVTILHPAWHARGEDFQGLPDYSSRLHSMGFEQRMEDLQHNSLVDSKLGNDVG